MHASEAFYRLLLRAYPKRFRLRYEQDMVRWFLDHQAVSRRQGGPMSGARFWYLILADLVTSVPAQHVNVMKRDVRQRPTQPRNRGEPVMETCLQDTKVALRSFVRSPALFVLIVTTLAVGIGFATTIYSVIDGVLLAPLPYADSERLAKIGTASEGEDRLYAMSAPDAFDLEEQVAAFSRVAVSQGTRVTVRGDDAPEIEAAAVVSSGFFEVLGAEPLMGRAFGREEDVAGAPHVVVLGHGLWQRRWGGDRAILGQAVTLGRTPFTVIGVMPPDFLPPEALGQRDAEIWLPFSLIDSSLRESRSDGWLQVMGRLRANVSFEQAHTELAAFAARRSAAYPEIQERSFGLSPLHRETIGRIGDKLLPLFGAVGLLLAIACANVANLLLVRAETRGREMALRTAIGASRSRIVRQLMTEGLILGLVGSVFGAVIAATGVKVFVALNPGDIPRIAEVDVDGKVLAFAFLVSILTSLVFGLIPALRGSAPNLTGRLKDGGRGLGTGMSHQRLRGGLVVLEIAVAFVLVVGAGLLINSFVRLQNVDMGFDARNVEILGVAHSGGTAPEATVAFFDHLVEHAASVPGVVAAGATSNLPLSGQFAMNRIEEVEGRPDYVDDGGVYYQHVTSGFFRAMGIALRQGRVFDRTDRPDTHAVAVVNESMARKLFGTADPIGRRFQSSDGDEETWHEVIGVVSDVRTLEVSRAGSPEMYLAFNQSPRARMDVVLRTEAGLPSVLPAMRDYLRGIRPDLPVRRSIRMEDFVADAIVAPRFYTLVLGSFAGVALLLALVGIYGTLAYSVSRQKHEFGVRLALGASGTSVLTMVLRRGLRLVLMGIVLGFGVALVATRVLASLVFGVTTTDGTTMALGVVAVLFTAFIASMLPALRATQLDPVAILHRE